MSISIKTWNQLDRNEQMLAMDFFIIHGQPYIEQSWDERKEYLFGPIFGHGKNLFFAICESIIVGTLACVLLEIKVKGKAYITEINILKEYRNHEIVNLLLDVGIKRCKISHAKKVLMGIKPHVDFIEKNLLLAGFEMCYHALELVKEEKEIYDVNIKYKPMPLSESLVREYAVIMSDAFLNTPNGSSVTIEDAMKLLKDNKKSAGILWDLEENQPVGAYETTIIAQTGWLDTLAIAPKYQGLGYGKQLFRQLQNLLWRKEVSALKLIVIDSNKHAYDMYIKHNFKLSKLLSTWYFKNTR